MGAPEGSEEGREIVQMSFYTDYWGCSENIRLPGLLCRAAPE